MTRVIDNNAASVKKIEIQGKVASRDAHGHNLPQRTWIGRNTCDESLCQRCLNKVKLSQLNSHNRANIDERVRHW